MVKYLIYPIIKCSLDQVPDFFGLITKYFELFYLCSSGDTTNDAKVNLHDFVHRLSNYLINDSTFTFRDILKNCPKSSIVYTHRCVFSGTKFALKGMNLTRISYIILEHIPLQIQNFKLPKLPRFLVHEAPLLFSGTAEIFVCDHKQIFKTEFLCFRFFCGKNVHLTSLL